MTEIFVFGSNLSGIHGAGAAKYAHKIKGAEWGVANGPTGSSYAIPTKDKSIKNTLSLNTIRVYVRGFIAYAEHIAPENTYQVTRIGCGLAGLRDEDIAPMFKDAPSNCRFDEAWKPYLGEEKEYWGTF